MTFPKLRNPIGAVILDMDGTLHDTEIVYYRALKHAVAATGFSASDSLCRSLIGIPGKECDLILQEHFGSSFPFAECNRLFAEHRDDLLSQGVPLKPGAVELLDDLVAEGIPTAVATSSSRRTAESHLARSGLRNRLATLVTRDDVERGKPYPDLFLTAARMLNILPTACLAVEDSVAGIRAAHSAGMMVVMVPDLVAPTADIRALCVHVASDLHEVREIAVKHWNAR
ncbi:HAD family hydrolase [Consotaella aegiceratis]|uniref:HAD family hydrolase n=1 Tax=Consotaella aegiceratis TaxID=3097961 RepID=UPI002F3FC863